MLLAEGNVLGTGNIPLDGVFDDININGFGLSNSKVFITKFNVSPNSDLQSYNNPLIDGKSFLSYNMRGGTISMNLTIRGDNEADFMDLLKRFRENIYKQNSLLNYKINGEERSVIVNCSSNPFEFLNFNITFLSFPVNFSYLDFTFSRDKQTLSLFQKTGNFNQEITNLGTQKSEITFYFVFKQTTNLTKIKIINGDEYIEVENNFTRDDILIIDAENISVKKNDVEIDYSGVLLFLSETSNRLFFEFSGDVKADIFILNPKKYK